MLRENCFQLGTLLRKVGTDGRLLLEMDTDNPKAYQKTERVFVDLHGTLVPFSVSSLRLMPGGTAHLGLAEIQSEEMAKTLLGSAVYLPLEALPVLKGNRFYYHEVIDWSIFDESTGTDIGTISDVLENGPNDLFVVKNGEDEILIPITDAFLRKVDRNARTIRMELPEGLLTVNRKTQNDSEQES